MAKVMLSIKKSVDPKVVPPLAAAASKTSPEQIENFVNFLQVGKRTPVDYANELSKRGYWGASDMYKGAQDSAAQFAIDNRVDPKQALKNYNDARKNSALWHTELIQHVLGEAKRLGMPNKEAILNNKDLLLKSSRISPEDFNAVTNQPAGNGETKGQNFWRVAGDLYDDLNKKEAVQTLANKNNQSTLLANK